MFGEKSPICLINIQNRKESISYQDVQSHYKTEHTMFHIKKVRKKTIAAKSVLSAVQKCR